MWRIKVKERIGTQRTTPNGRCDDMLGGLVFAISLDVIHKRHDRSARQCFVRE